MFLEDDHEHKDSKEENRPLIGLIGLIKADSEYIKNQGNQSHQPNQWSILLSFFVPL